MDDLKNNKYCRHQIGSEEKQPKQDEIVVHDPEVDMQEMIRGTVEIDDQVKCIDVPLKAPNGDMLLNTPISFVMKKGKNCLLIGPNGCGKSSLYRILGQLWPLSGGELTIPTREKIFYLP